MTRRLASFRKGDNAERLAEFLLGTFAFTTGVPRQEDVGHDFHCVLAEPSTDGKTVHAGPFFSVQVKSGFGVGPLEYSSSEKIDWIWEQDNPFFVCTVNRDELTCQMFTTWNLLNAVLLYPKQKIILAPNEEIDVNVPTLLNERARQIRVPLGPPILSFSAKDAVSTEWPVKCATVMRPWIELDRANIVRRRNNVYHVLAPRSWNPNETFIGNADYHQWTYWNPHNLGDACRNLILAAEALDRVVTSGGLIGEPKWVGRVEAARRVLTQFGR